MYWRRFLRVPWTARISNHSILKKIRDIKGTFHVKMGTIKDRNGMDLTEAEDIKRWWWEYTEKLYKKDVHDPDNHDGVITHLEPDILECEVKWALESITMNKASGGDGIPVVLFQILKRWCCESSALNMPTNLENSAVAIGLEQCPFLSQSQSKAMPKNVQTTTQLHSSHTVAK